MSGEERNLYESAESDRERRNSGNKRSREESEGEKNENGESNDVIGEGANKRHASSHPYSSSIPIPDASYTSEHYDSSIISDVNSNGQQSLGHGNVGEGFLSNENNEIVEDQKDLSKENKNGDNKDLSTTNQNEKEAISIGNTGPSIVPPGGNPGSVSRRGNIVSYVLSIPVFGIVPIMNDDGAIAKEIRMQSGANLFIQTKEEAPQNASRRSMRVEGTWDQTLIAQRRILEVLRASADQSSPDLSEETLIMMPISSCPMFTANNNELLSNLESETNTIVKIYMPTGGGDARNALVVIRGRSSFEPGEERETQAAVMRRLESGETRYISVSKKPKPAKRRGEEESAVNAIKKALKVENLTSDIPSLSERHAYLEVPVASRFSGSVIGQGASVVRQLENQSGAKIRLSREGTKYTTPTEVLRFVAVEGSGHSVRRAYKLIVDQVRDAMDRTMNDFDGVNTYEVPLTVPDHLIAVIIGKGGRALRDLQDSTRTKIHVEHSARGERMGGTRLVEIRGRPDDVESTQRLIVDRLIDASTIPFDTHNVGPRNENEFRQGPPGNETWQAPDDYRSHSHAPPPPQQRSRHPREDSRDSHHHRQHSGTNQLYDAVPQPYQQPMRNGPGGQFPSYDPRYPTPLPPAPYNNDMGQYPPSNVPPSYPNYNYPPPPNDFYNMDPQLGGGPPRRGRSRSNSRGRGPPSYYPPPPHAAYPPPPQQIPPPPASSALENRDSMKLSIPVNQVGAVIGQKGSMIKHICDVSGARVHIQAREEVPPGATTREISISGSAKQVQDAFDLVEKALTEFNAEQQRGGNNAQAQPQTYPRPNAQPAPSAPMYQPQPPHDPYAMYSGMNSYAPPPPSQQAPILDAKQMDLLSQLASKFRGQP